jgi:flagellin
VLSSIPLTAGVRQNLLALPMTAAMMATTRNGLAADKHLNAALEHPAGALAASSNAPGDFAALRDSIAQAQQALKAADTGITLLSALMLSADAIATRALQAPAARTVSTRSTQSSIGATGYSSITGSQAIAADTTQASATADVATAGTPSQGPSLVAALDLPDLTGLSDGASVRITLGTATRKFTYTTAAGVASAGTFHDGRQFVAAVIDATGGFGGAVTASSVGIVIMAGNDLTSRFVVEPGGDAALTALFGAPAAPSVGDALTVSTGSETQSFYRVRHAASAANRTYSDAASLQAAIAASPLCTTGPVTAAVNGTGVDIRRTDGGSLTFSGNAAVAAGYATAASGTTCHSNHNVTLGGRPGSPTIRLTMPATSPNSFAAANISPSSPASLSVTDAAILALAPEATVAVQFNAYTATFTRRTAGANPNAGTFTTGAEFAAALTGHLGLIGIDAVNTPGSATRAAGKDIVNNFQVTGVAHTSSVVVRGDVLTVSNGASASTFYQVAAGADPITGTYTTLDDLCAAINHWTGGGITASASSGCLSLASAGPITVSGAAALKLGWTIPRLPALSGDLTVRVGANPIHAITCGSGHGQVSTRTGLDAALAAFADITASVDAGGHVDLASTSAGTVTIGGHAAILAALGLAAGAVTPTAIAMPTTTVTTITTVTTPDPTRANLQAQFNDLLARFDRTAKDASRHGVNLLDGDSLRVVFNQTGSSSLTIAGVRFDSVGLGLNAISGAGFQDDTVVNDALARINTGLTTLRTQAAQFGSDLGTVQARQDFTTNMCNTPQPGTDHPVRADASQEGANMLALQTRQQLSTSALSMANQASQAVLRLFG